MDRYQVEILLSLALVAGGYALATALHVSAPIAMVVAGLLIGNHGRAFAMSETTRHHLDTFWELIDEVLNAVLFVLLGLEVLALKFTGPYLLVGLILIPIVLFARLVSVTLPVWLLRARHPRRAVHHPAALLGRAARRPLGGDGPVGARGRRRGAGAGARVDADRDLRRRRLLRPGAGDDRRPADAPLAPAGNQGRGASLAGSKALRRYQTSGDS